MSRFIRPGDYTGNRIIAQLGDSMTDQGQASAGRSIYRESEGWQTWAGRLCDQRVHFAYSEDFGVNGDTTSDVVARLAAVEASPASTVVILIGTNDVSGGIASETTIANHVTIRDRLLAANKQLIWLTVMPRGNATYTGMRRTGDGLIQHMRMRQWVLDQEGYPGVYPVDTWPTFADLAATAGDIIAGVTKDGTHQNPAGAFLMGQLIADKIRELFPACPILPASSADAYDPIKFPRGNLVTNPMMSGSGGSLSGGATGSPPDSWTALAATGGSLAASKEVRSDLRDWVKIVAGGAPSANNAIMGLRQTLAHASARAGEAWEAVADVDVDASASGIQSVTLRLFATVNGANVSVRDADPTGTRSAPVAAYGGVMRTPPLVLDADPTALSVAVEIYNLTASGALSVTAYVKDVAVRRVGVS